MRFFYAGSSFMGLKHDYKCGCWRVYRFPSKKMLNEWLKNNGYNNSNIQIAKKILYRDAMKIICYHRPTMYYDGDVVYQDQHTNEIMAIPQ